MKSSLEAYPNSFNGNHSLKWSVEVLKLNNGEKLTKFVRKWINTILNE